MPSEDSTSPMISRASSVTSSSMAGNSSLSNSPAWWRYPRALSTTVLSGYGSSSMVRILGAQAAGRPRRIRPLVIWVRAVRAWPSQTT
jgi:hypothetical protein